MGSNKTPSQRQLRVGEVLRHALSEIFTRGDVNHPDLDGVVITVTEVTATPDLRSATAYVMPLGGGDGETLIAALNATARYTRGLVARKVALKFMPQIAFRLDSSFDYSASVDRLLDDPRVRRDVESAGDVEADDVADDRAGR